jgi:hypothetical protein
VGPGDDLGSLACLRSQSGGVTNDDSDRLIAVEQAGEDFLADLASRGGDDDHDRSLKQAG